MAPSARPTQPYSNFKLPRETISRPAQDAFHSVSSRTRAERFAGRSAPSSSAAPFAASTCGSCLNAQVSLAPRWKAVLYLLNQPQSTPHPAQMAPWPYSIPSYLRTDLLHPYIFSVLTVTTLTEARSQTNSSSFTDLPEHDPIFSFEYFQRSFFIVLGHVSNLARQRNVRKLAGQIGLWDIGFFVMACGLMQSIRIWKKRRQTQREGSVLSNCSIAGSRHGRENIRASLDDDGKSRKGECEYLIL